MKLEDYKDISARCSECNFCQAVCPVFISKGSENWLARNRLNLIREVLIEKTMEPSPRFTEILETCLLCTGCTQSCSSMVPVDEIIIAARSRMAEYAGGVSSMKKKLFSGVMKNSSAINLMVKAGAVAQKFGMAPGNLPQMSSKPFFSRRSGTLKPDGIAEARVAYYVGCGTNFFYPETGEAATDILLKMNTEVIIPEGLTCCGIPLLSEGDIEGAAEVFKKNIEILASIECDKILMECTSCIMMFMKKGPKLFAADDPVMEKVKAVNAKIENALTYIYQKKNPGINKKAPGNFTCHVPCHLNKSEKGAGTAEILRTLTGAEYRELDEPESCCGAGGAYYMKDKELSETIREIKLKDIRKREVSIVVTECPMCRYYISKGVPEMEVMHPLEFIKGSML
jgi:glycolate oxidase iron-sulfur subunit